MALSFACSAIYLHSGSIASDFKPWKVVVVLRKIEVLSPRLAAYLCPSWFTARENPRMAFFMSSGIAKLTRQSSNRFRQVVSGFSKEPGLAFSSALIAEVIEFVFRQHGGLLRMQSIYSTASSKPINRGCLTNVKSNSPMA